MKTVMPRWLIWTLVALVSWGVWAVLSKIIGDALTAAQSQAWSTLGLLPVIGALAFSSKPAVRPTRARGISCAVAAGLVGCVGNIAYYHALNLGGKASTVTPLTALYPLVTVILALLLLKERLNIVQVAAIGLSLGAIYLFNVQNESGVLTPWLAYALIPIVLWGVAGLLQKISTNHISAESSTLWFLLSFVPVAIVILLTRPWPEHFGAKTGLLVVALGLFFAVGNLAVLVAFASDGKASIITPLAGLYPLVSVPLAVTLLGERIGAREVAAIVVALVSVVALSYERPSQ